ncbi:MAG: hypothetical protein ACO323_03260 [Candidatus Kapaibacteriota bacterium]
MNHMLPDPQSMSNEQLAAQCIMPRLVPRDYVEQEALREEIAQLIQRGIGGFCVFQGEADATSLLLHDYNRNLPSLYCLALIMNMVCQCASKVVLTCHMQWR